MTSDTGASRGGLDERLAQARDAALQPGEEIVAQEAGDQGQAIVLTKSRVLLLKAGLTATGSVDGRRTSAYTADQITAVHLRRGPMGAAVEICTAQKPLHAEKAPSDNVTIFSGAQRAKKCEAIAARIAAVLDRPLERIEAPQSADSEAPIEIPPDPEEEAAPAKPKGGRKHKSLAEEMFEEISNEREPGDTADKASAPTASPESQEETWEKGSLEPVAVQQAQDMPRPARDGELVEPAEPRQARHERPEAEPLQPSGPDVEPEAVAVGLAPNPYLPKPAKRQRGPNPVLVLLCLLAAFVAVGVAVTTPLRNAPHKVPMRVTAPSGRPATLKAVSAYKLQTASILRQSEDAAATLRKALASGDRQALLSAATADGCEQAWRNMSGLSAPPGFAAARESILAGLRIRKETCAEVLGSLQSGSQIDKHRLIGRLDESNRLIKRGVALAERISRM